MGELSSIEQAAVERTAAEPMLDQVQAWAALNSGSRNLAGLATIAGHIADAFATLPGAIALVDPTPVDEVDNAGRTVPLAHGRNLHLKVRPEAPVQLLLTGHMDTVFAIDHPFQALTWLEDGMLNGPGVADMKGGIAVMLAALKASESVGIPNLGYEVIINSDEEV
ncbi:MAG: M20/M25/M40 family metallo-hydrolase, partial [Sphingomicrobium sp.]